MSKGLSKKPMKKGSKFGRPVGTKNKPGHRASGDRTSSAYKRKKQAQKKGFDGPLDHFWGEGGNGGIEGGDSVGIAEGSSNMGEIEGGGDDEDNPDDDSGADISEGDGDEVRQCKTVEEEAKKAVWSDLQSYAKSFRNGSIERIQTPEDDDSDFEDDGEEDNAS